MKESKKWETRIFTPDVSVMDTLVRRRIKILKKDKRFPWVLLLQRLSVILLMLIQNFELESKNPLIIFLVHECTNYNTNLVKKLSTLQSLKTWM